MLNINIHSYSNFFSLRRCRIFKKSLRCFYVALGKSHVFLEEPPPPFYFYLLGGGGINMET